MSGKTVVVAGIASESPLRLVHEALKRRNARVVLVNQRLFQRSRIRFGVVEGQVVGSLVSEEGEVDLAEVSGVYLRLMDETSLPEYRTASEETRALCASWHRTFIQWSEITPAVVLNRVSSMGSNGSKPYQSQIIREHGFAIPETLVSSDPAAVRDFACRHGRLIYKSASGVRSIVHEVGEGDLERLEKIRWCPTQFQALVCGTNVRVHVVGTKSFATVIDSDAVDYRYAGKDGAHLAPTQLDPSLVWRCIRLAAALKLPFAGIDLLLSYDGNVYCFEVNPSPGFSYYEASTGQPIADAVAALLMDSKPSAEGS